MSLTLKIVRFIATATLGWLCYVWQNHGLSLYLSCSIFWLLSILFALSALDWIKQSDRWVKIGLKWFAVMVLLAEIIYRMFCYGNDVSIGGAEYGIMFLSSVFSMILLYSTGSFSVYPKVHRVEYENFK